MRDLKRKRVQELKNKNDLIRKQNYIRFKQHKFKPKNAWGVD